MKTTMRMTMMAALLALAAPVFAAPAVFETVATSAPAGTSHVIATGTVANGDRQVMFYATPSGNPGATLPAGWTKLVEVKNTGSFGNQGCSMGLAYHDADGTEGPSINVTTTNAPKMEAVVYNLNGHDPATAPAFATLKGRSTTPQPMNLNPAAWGTEDTLWMVSACSISGNVLTAFPTNYVNDQYSINGFPMLGAASRVATASSESPGAFSTTGYAYWVAFTVAIRPSP